MFSPTKGSPLANISLDGLAVGQLTALGPRLAPSGIAKRLVQGPIWLGSEGLEGDVQGDRRIHGGPDKAVHHYPFDHYAFWREELDRPALLAAPPAFGENFSTIGLTEAEVAVGDRFRIGRALVEVSQGRQPCWKLDARFDVQGLARKVQATGRTGWYYRVVEEGPVEPGDELVLVDRGSPDWTIHRLWHILYVDRMNIEELQAMAALEHLPEGWRRHACRRLATGLVENWRSRLDGPDP
ncbi:MOSC domain-containing protein [Geminicoccus roseus]|uniref:MOSC domain-containing protein n=1 Tax=Geminicoccus roseus TaxID=404900 RepID=UPI000686D352|nr:MOSC domain-containing protein [Geminicoccus roseus]